MVYAPSGYISPMSEDTRLIIRVVGYFPPFLLMDTVQPEILWEAGC